MLAFLSFKDVMKSISKKMTSCGLLGYGNSFDLENTCAGQPFLAPGKVLLTLMRRCYWQVGAVATREACSNLL